VLDGRRSLLVSKSRRPNEAKSEDAALFDPPQRIQDSLGSDAPEP
jgi:hypothetical protein